MYNFVITLILILLSVSLILGGGFSAAAQATRQSTHGSNSPAAYTQKGNITITINELKEIKKVVQKAIEAYESGKDIERAELKKRIADIHKTQINVLPEEADKWADQFISTLPLRKDKVTTEEDEEFTRFEKHQVNIPILIEYSIKKFDEYIIALKKHDKKIDFRQEQLPEIITHANSSKDYSSLRIASFPNGTTLTLSLRTGVIGNNRFQNYPSIRIDLMKNGTQEIMLWIEKEQASWHYNSLGYLIYGQYKDGELTDYYKKTLTKAYDIIIQEAYLRTSKAPVRHVQTVP